jgi:hypothetical protein
MTNEVELKTIPFSDAEALRKYHLSMFYEGGHEFAVLTIVANGSLLYTHGNIWEFGYISNISEEKKEMFWFFNRNSRVKGRDQAIFTYQALKQYCEDRGLGQPFAFKVSKNYF